MTLTIYPPTDCLVEVECTTCFDVGIAFCDDLSLALGKSLPCPSCRPRIRAAVLRKARQ